jgi:hypothetical protein
MSKLYLNGFRIRFSSDEFTGYVRAMADNKELKPLRNQLKGSWFLHWQEGVCYGLPKAASPATEFGETKTLRCAENLKLLAARIHDVLPEKFPDYEAFRRRPFTFRGKKGEMVEAIRGKLAGLPQVMNGFKIHPKFELDARLIELREGVLEVGLFLVVSTNWLITASLDELVAAGVNIQGLYVVRRNPEPEQRRLVGRIRQLSGLQVLLSESFDGTDSICADDVMLEGSRASFSQCLKQLLGNRYESFEKERQFQEAACLTGPALDVMVTRMGGYLAKASPITLCSGLQCSVGEQIVIENVDSYKTHLLAPPVDYCFDSARSKRHKYAWQGLDRFGPFSRDTFGKKSPRILVVFPDSVQGTVERFLRYFRDGVNLEQGNSAFSGGFAKTFGLVNPEFVFCRVPWLAKPTGKPSHVYRKAVEDFLSANGSFDAAIVVVLNEHEKLPDTDNPYLHSKAVLLMAGIPVQDVRVSTISQAEINLQYSLQNIAVALYAKLNGIPWTVDHDLSIADELVIGVGTCELLESRFVEKQRFIGITTVFRGDGNYLLSNLSSECSYQDYPAVLEKSTVQILEEIKRRNGWQKGDTVRVVVHSFKPLKNVEVGQIMRKCVESVGNEQNIEFAFLTVTQEHSFLILDKEQRGIAVRNKHGAFKATYVPMRGLISQLGSFTRLLCTNGPELIKRETSPLPAPLLVHIHPESTYRSLSSLTEQVLKFTSLSWRSTLPAKLPVTIYYSDLIAGLLSRLKHVPDWSPAMLNVKLRASKWFL